MRFDRPIIRLSSAVLLAAALFVPALYGQSVGARLSGTVTDSTGAAFPGASASAVYIATG